MKRNNGGFSMIEVLVASTIMLMMVMMLGMLFQQTSQAWQTGKQRANAYQQVRSFFGAIQQDASSAINTNSLPGVPNKPQTFDGSLAFFTLTGTGLKGGTVARRSLKYVTYKGATRTVATYLANPSGGYTAGDSSTTQFDNSDPNGATIEVGDMKAYAFDTDGKTENFNPSTHSFPAYVTVQASVSPNAVKSYNVGAASGGPDKTMGKSPTDIRGRDDIKTWAE